MTKYIHLHDMIFNQPQLCTPQYAETILAVIGDKLGVEQSAYQVNSEEARKSEDGIYGRTKVVSILGSMTHRGSSLDAMSGISSYQDLQAQIQEALDNPNIKSILLDVDSPGGTVAGAFDFADFIAESKEQKPIYAIARDQMCSAAYLISSAATKVYATQTAQVGSIGVVAMHMDQSERNKKEGLKPTFIYAGDYKVAGNPHESLEGDALDYLKESVAESYDMFVNAVASNRGLDEQAIRDTEARVYKGSKAKEIGLVDEVTTFNALIQELASTPSPQRVSFPSMSKGNKMDKEEIEKLEADFAQVSAEVEGLKEQNESLRKALIENGFKITAEGVEAPETAQEEAPKEILSVDGKDVDLSAMPEEAAALLKAMVADKEAAALEAKAKEMFPNMDLASAKVFAGMDLPETAVQTLKAADAMFAENMEEVGETGADGDMIDPKEKLDTLVEAHMDEHGVDIHKARAEVLATKEGRALQKQIKKG